MDQNVRLEKQLKWISWLFIALGGAYLVVAAIPPLHPAQDFVFPRGSTGSLFWIWLVALAFGQGAFNRDLASFWRIVLIAIAGSALVYGLTVTFHWASGWLPPLIAIVAVIWAARPRLALPLSAILLGLTAVFLQRALDLILINEEYSVVTRLEAWKIITRMVLSRNPMLGFGPANYRFYTVFYRILGWNVQFNSHNQYIDLLAQTGVLGTLAFLWLLAAVGLLLWRLRNHPNLSRFSRAYAYSAFGGLVGMVAAGGIADWILPYIYNITLSGVRSAAMGWIFLGGAASLFHIANRSREQAQISGERSVG